MTKRRMTYNQLDDRLFNIQFAGLLTGLMPGLVIMSQFMEPEDRINLMTAPIWWSMAAILSTVIWIILFVLYWITLHHKYTMKQTVKGQPEGIVSS